jgi:nucleoside-diphosphate-sugar epimerase
MFDLCVTGCSSYLASHIINELLSVTCSLNIIGTVRNINNRKKYEHLLDIAARKNASNRLRIVEADILNEQALDKAIEGCAVVLHVGSAVLCTITDPYRQVYEPIVCGTKNVLNSCLKHGVKRLIVTSSCATVQSPASYCPSKKYDEKDWNSDSTLEKHPYWYSKTEQEKLCWDFAQNHPELDIVCLNPSFLLGPPLNRYTCCSELNQSTKFMLYMMKRFIVENTVIASSTPNIIDVRDVAKVHVMAITSVNISLKRILIGGNKATSWAEAVRCVREDIMNMDYHPLYDKLRQKLENRSDPVVIEDQTKPWLLDCSEMYKLFPDLKLTPLRKSFLDTAIWLAGAGML